MDGSKPRVGVGVEGGEGEKAIWVVDSFIEGLEGRFGRASITGSCPVTKGSELRTLEVRHAVSG